LGCYNTRCCISWYAAYSAAKVAAKVAVNRVLPEGGWVLGAVNKLGVLALSKEVILGVNLRAIEYLIRCVFVYILSWLKLDTAGASYWCSFAARY